MASKLTTVSAQDMIKAMIAGERDARVLAGLARGRMKTKRDDLMLSVCEVAYERACFRH